MDTEGENVPGKLFILATVEVQRSPRDLLPTLCSFQFTYSEAEGKSQSDRLTPPFISCMPLDESLNFSMSQFLPL